MDNQDKIKYKEAGNGWFIKIFLDNGGNEHSRTGSFKDGKGSGTGLYKEMQAWIAAGNEIEPRYTAEELVEKEAKELEQTLESQKLQCEQLLNESDKKIVSDTPYPDDIPAWTVVRTQWRTIIKSNQIETIPEPPF